MKTVQVHLFRNGQYFQIKMLEFLMNLNFINSHGLVSPYEKEKIMMKFIILGNAVEVFIINQKMGVF